MPDPIFPRPQTRPKRTRLRRTLAVLAIGAVLAVLYGFFVEPSWPQLTRVTLTLPHLPAAADGFTIVQLSDLHFGTTMSHQRLRTVVELTNRTRPDLIVITGDFLIPIYAQPHLEREIAALAAILARLRARHGVVAIWGNHDRLSHPHLQRALDPRGITFLRNEAWPVPRGDAPFWIVGLDDLWGGVPLPATAVRTVPPGACSIALVHEPDYALTLTDYPIDLQLSGHSHGGQVRLPFFGPLYVPRDSRHFPEGLRRAGALQVYTNRGLGMTGLPLRLFCRPEITHFTLRAP